MVARKSRFGKIFFSCSTFPDCDVIVNQVEQLATKYPNHPRTPYQKKRKEGKRQGENSCSQENESSPAKKAAKPKAAASKEAKVKKTRTMPSYPLSAELTAIVGATELTRGEVTKKVWDYIKSHNLQDAANKRLIKPDPPSGQGFRLGRTR